MKPVEDYASAGNDRPAARLADRQTAIVLICTRNRPSLLAECIASCGKIEENADLRVLIGIADNNDTPNEATIREIAVANGIDILYAHEPRRGYSSVRNCALGIARDAGADIAIFLDDDSRADPRLALEHAAALKRYGADAILGRIEGLSRRPREGRRVTKAGAGNVSIRRRVFATAPDGLGLEFDERLNLLGQEDREFFADLIRRGGSIRQSCGPVTLNSSAHEANPAASDRPFQERLVFAEMEGRNEIVVARIRHGRAHSLVTLARRQAPQTARLISEAVSAALLQFYDAPRARKNRESARVRIAKIGGAFTGLWRPGYERQSARRGRLIELPETGSSGTMLPRTSAAKAGPADNLDRAADT